ncbi:hypothetical protein Ddye_008028 [Dipteronia dyeriana]|uniref:Small auxin up regulated protein n=1 Tax=Dipteronia dyeriana TaxID=168575 RepID=A0AAD9X8L7_9ROSI|nr:hypothetical protein Ddye_008028 [Dipteronia dyeriana]
MSMKSSKHMDQAKTKRRRNCSIRVKNAMGQLQEQILKWRTREYKRISSTYNLGTVKGHFSVLVLSNGETQKFLVALRYLSHPPFIKLLEAAEQEFGFDQKGALVIPCEASELKRILS